MQSTYPSQQIIAQQIGYDVPVSGALTVRLALNFTNNGDFTDTTNTITADLSTSQSAANTENVQSAYIDNSQNASPLTIKMTSTGQVVTVPAYSQTWQPLLVSSNNKYQFTTQPNSNPSTGFVAGPFVTVFLSNIPIPNGSSNSQNVVINRFGSYGLYAPTFVPTQRELQSFNALGVVSGPLTFSTLYGMFITDISVYLTADFRLAAPGTLKVDIQAAAQYYMGFQWDAEFWVPSTAPTVLTLSLPIKTPENFIFVGNPAQTPLITISSSSTIASGHVMINWGGGSIIPGEGQPL